MTDNLNIAIIPLDITEKNKDANLSALAEKMTVLRPDTDIVVLPELFSTGFIQTPEEVAEFAETSGGKTLEFIRNLAALHNCAIAGTYLSTIAGTYLNRGFFIEPLGDETFYDKRHLLCISPENRLVSHGIGQCDAIRFRGWDLSMVICYDIRFPVWCRNVKNRYEVLIVPANWPSARAYAWEHLLIARAIENQAYVVGANRSGSDNYGSYDNLSFVFDPMGVPVAAQGESGIIYATLTKKMVGDTRHKMPVVNDADTFNLKL